MAPNEGYYEFGSANIYLKAGHSSGNGWYAPSISVGNSLPESLVVWPDENDAQQVQRLYNRAVRPVADMVLNVVELEQLGNLHKSFLYGYPDLKKKWNAMNRQAEKTLGQKLSTRTGGRFSKAALKKLSDLHLATSFGVLPLINDISDLTKGWNGIGKRLRQLKQTPRRRETSTSNGTVIMSPQTVTNKQNGILQIDRTVINSPIKRYVLVYDYKLPTFLNEDLNKIAYYASRMTTGPAGILWEATPWSFVVDWFLDTSGLVMSLNDIVTQSPIKTVSCTKSVKWGIAISSRFDVMSGCSPSQVVGAAGSSRSEYSCYERDGLSREIISIPLSNRFDMKQLCLTASLLVQRIR